MKAVETVDHCLGRILDAIQRNDAQMFLCADHGNVEQLKDYTTGEPFTAHTTNPVPFVLVNYKPGVGLREGGRLADIAPTLLEMMGSRLKPEDMTGQQPVRFTKKEITFLKKAGVIDCHACLSVSTYTYLQFSFLRRNLLQQNFFCIST